MVKASAPRRSLQSGPTPSRDEAEGVTKHQPQAQGVRRNCPWTEAEHLLFLLGLEEHGRGAWRAIASDFVGTRTATQVASHAQKYFLREGLPPSKREKKRPSIHDIRCSRNASQEDRYQLRNSLQQLNRESMESNDSRHADPHAIGAKAGTGALAGRAGRPRAETGSSGDTSVAAGSRPALSTANWNSDAGYSFGADGSAMRRSVAMDTLGDRPRAHSLPDWQFPGRSAPLMSGADMFSVGGTLPDTADPAVSILDPLYDEVLNCDLSPDPGPYSQTPPGRASEMSLEHSFDQTHLMRGNSASETRLLFPLSEAQPTAPEDGLMLGSAPARAPAPPDRRMPWQAPLYSAYGSASMYDSMFQPNQGNAAFAQGQPPAAPASLPNFQQPQHFSMQDLLPERRMMASFDASHCTQPSPTGSLPHTHVNDAQTNRGLGDSAGSNIQLQQLGPLLSSQSAPPANSMSVGAFSSALYRPTQVALATTAPMATDPAFGNTAARAAAMPSGDSVDDLRILAQRADEMGISATDLDHHNMDEILGSMSLGMDMDL